MEETNITISKYEYDDLNRIKYKYNNILAIIFKNTYIKYNGELDYDYEQIDKMLKIFEPTSYKLRITQLNIKDDNNE